MVTARVPVSFRLIAALLAAGSALTACATFSADGGFDKVADTAHARLGLDARWPRTDAERGKRDADVAALLGRPLTPDDAVQIALLNNHAMQASFAKLGVSEADLVQSGRLANPRFTLRHAQGGGAYDIEETLTFNVVSLLATPFAHAAEQRRFAQIQSALVIEIAQLADQTRAAYYTAVAARDSLRYAQQVKDTAQAGAELARRMLDAGNWNRLDQSRQDGFYAAALQQLARARLADDGARGELYRLLGMGAEAAEVRLAEHLPDLPQHVVDTAAFERTAMESRIDLQLRRTELDRLARRLKLTKATRLVNVLDLGPTRVQEGARDAPAETGYEVSIEVPIFDTGDARVRRAEAHYRESVELLAQAAIDARAQIRAALSRYQTAFDLAVRQRDEIMPIAKSISQQDLLRYNASLVSVFDLLADARNQIASVDEYIDSVRDFWIAKSHLDAALVAGPSGVPVKEYP
jgi:outer membrane protein TolC